MAGISLQVRDLHKSFHKGGHEIHVLRGAELDLGPGDHAAVLGPSGSGKSTFLHVVGTLDRPNRGAVTFDGDDVFRLSPRKLDARRNRDIGFIFQFHHLLSDQTALWNVALACAIAGKSTREALDRAEEVLVRLQLGHRLQHRPGELSGGEQQRVAIARAMVMRPGLLLADEPTGNLDPRTAAQVFQAMLDLNAEVGSTLIVVTHSTELASRLPRQLFLSDGRFVDGAEAGGRAV